VLKVPHSQVLAVIIRLHSVTRAVPELVKA